MPLVASHLDENDSNSAEAWTNKLAGKTVSDEPHSETNFCKKDLPEVHRILAPGSIATRDFRQDRINVHTTEEGTVTHITKG